MTILGPTRIEEVAGDVHSSEVGAAASSTGGREEKDRFSLVSFVALHSQQGSRYIVQAIGH